MSRNHILLFLGNPGERYQSTRHNLGYMCADMLAARERARWKRPAREYQYAEISQGGTRLRLLKPMTYMNLSGRAAKPFVLNYDVAFSDMLVVYDDFHLDFGQLRLRRKGSDGGHNGVSSLIEVLGSQDFSRLRLGVGEPKGKQSTEDFVLSEFNTQEKKELDFFIQDAAECCRLWVTTEIEQVMSQFNKRKGDG